MTWNKPPSVHGQNKGYYAEVIVPRHISKSFTYRVPLQLRTILEVGHWVLVPFGRVVLEGIVISLSPQPPVGIHPHTLKAIYSLTLNAEQGKLPPILFELSRKVAEYYVAPWGQCLRLIVPTMTKEQTVPSRYIVTAQGRIALEAGHCPGDLRSILHRIARRSTGLLSSTLHSTRQATSALIIKTLLDKGWITATPNQPTGVDVLRLDNGRLLHNPEQGSPKHESPLAIEELEASHPWNSVIAESLGAGQTKKIVLHAPWPQRISRLAAAIRHAYDMNKSIVIITGEVAKAIWLRHLLVTITKLPITLLHSTSKSDYRQNHDESPAIIVGTRSAIFTATHPVGLIWVDGEEDPAFKEQEEPRYHAREVAWLRAGLEQALLVLATSHPTLESRFDPDAEIHTLVEEDKDRPKTELVDLRREPGGSILSEKLIQTIRDTLNNRDRIVLFLNRKGYAGTLVCRECGWVPRCTSCTIPLAYYRDRARLVCRYCPVTNELPDCCPRCHSSRLSPIGEGTEGVEAEVRRLFPHAKIIRLDSTTLRTRSAGSLVWEELRSGAWDIVIGTQVLFQREPLPPQGLVAVLHADSGLHISDFRAAERTYHLMVDAASLARPASVGGRLILQTRLPQHHAVQAILTGHPHRFYDEELSARRLLGYPPSCRLADLWIIGKDVQTVERASKQWAAHLGALVGNQDSVTVLGPIPVTNRRSPDRYQHRILVKAADHHVLRSRLSESVQCMEQEYRTGHVKFVVDIDPVELG